ncbi:MAG: PD-(D/E)XK nuclease family protein [Bacteroidota bacterium]
MYLDVYFGLELEDKVYPKGDKVEVGVHYFGPKGLLSLLEEHLGLVGHSNTIDYLRIAQYRHALQQYLKQNPDAFYAQSFEADQLAAAEELLNRRDELKLAGWDFDIDGALPKRLLDLAQVEEILDEVEYEFATGFADRFTDVLEACDLRPVPIRKIFLNEPRPLFPCHWQRLLDCLEANDVEVESLPEPTIGGDSDLDVFQRGLLGDRQKVAAGADGSLLIIRAKRETDAATFLAKTIRLNPDYRPVCLIPEKNRALDNALVQEGLPSLGILSASLARPTLQIIKLVTTFLWRPIDPYKVLEFVTLPIKPLEGDLAVLIARQIAQRPGLNSDNWYASINQYFEEKEAAARTDSSIKIDKIRREYQFWFERRRYDISKSLPKDEVVEVFEYIAEWASKKYEADGSVNTSLIVLSEQSKRIKELMEALPESYNFLTNLELERIVRTIYQPSPIQFQEVQVGHLPFVYHPSALIKPVDDLLWWNFSMKERPSFFSKWYQKEIDFLKNLEVELETPKKENDVLIWQRKRPMLQAAGRLILVIPERVEGKEVLAHPLLGDLEATFSNLEAITFDLDAQRNGACLESSFELPQWVNLSQQPIGQPKPVLTVENKDIIDEREHETFTSLDSLFYYPYQWVFRHKVRLHKSSILSVTSDNALLGNLAHRIIELLLKEDVQQWKKSDVENWIDQRAPRLFAREAATLLMYGREPERLAFLNTIKYAAWSLLSSIQQNGWRVKGTEMDLNGHFLGIPVKGKADLVLERGEELAVVDLKWRGGTYRKQVIKNEEDLQLVMYSKLLTKDLTWAHTAYFILEKGEMIARNNQAFQNCVAVNPDCDYIEVNERIWAKMTATMRWRRQQLEKGQIEIRTQQTQPELEELYEGELMELLEMRDGNAPFDDYGVLIGLVK